MTTIIIFVLIGILALYVWTTRQEVQDLRRRLKVTADIGQSTSEMLDSHITYSSSKEKTGQKRVK